MGSADMANFLVLCPRLEKLVAIGYATPGEAPSDVDAKLFIDYHKTGGTHWPWKCKLTLWVLRIRLTGVPRQGGADETSHSWLRANYYIGVFGRLAPLRKLDELCLGYLPAMKDTRYLLLTAFALKEFAPQRKLRQKQNCTISPTGKKVL